jgi:trk system potassium uptake protein
VNYKAIFYINGILLLVLSASMLAPMALDLADASPDWRVFGSAHLITAFAGCLMIFVNHQKSFSLTLRDAFLMTCVSWITLAAFGALPFCLSQLQLSFTDAFFESMAGITTTGSTVITGLDDLPRGILLWRSILQWLGGIGFLIVALAILPLLQISGMQIFKTQSFDIEKMLPSGSQIALFICLIYAAMTAACALLLTYAGMPVFHAICHALTTVSTGGFSTSDQSIRKFDSAGIEAVLATFMILGSLPFALYLRVMRGDLKSLRADRQVRAFFGILFFMTAILTVHLILTSPFDFFGSLRHAAFSVVSLLTSTGFATENYSTWSPFAIGLIFVITFIGGCSGSTTGGIKIFRLQILWSMLKTQIDRLIVPNGVFQVHYARKPVDLTVQNSVCVFFFVYIAAFLIGGMTLMLFDLDFVTAFTGSLAMVSNTGAGLGEILGPAGNFSTLPEGAIWVLSAGMLLGRLEILTVLVLFSPRFWKQ